MKTTKGGFVGFVQTEPAADLDAARLENLAGTVSLLVKQVRELEKQMAELKARQTRDKNLWTRLKESVTASEES
jgi:cell division protein FtsB